MSTLAQVSEKFDIDLIPKQHKLLEKILSPLEKSLELVTHAKQGELTQYAHCLCDINQ